MKRVLIVSPRFPPSHAPDMHRVRSSLPYLREFGWDPTVLAVDAAHCDAPVDSSLTRTIPAGARVIRTSAVDLRATRPLGVGSFELRALPFLSGAGGRLLAREEFDLVFFSTTAFAVTALGPKWRARYGTPFIVDFQDPWVTDYYSRPSAPAPPGGQWKYSLAQRLARWLEPRTMRSVDHVISVSPAYREDLMARYPWLARDQFTVLPFGAPTTDWEMLRDEGGTQSVFDPADGLQHWVYAGAAGDIMRMAVRALMSALGNYRRRNPEGLRRVRLHFIGTDYAPPRSARKTVEPIARECGVADIVEERTSRAPYLEALQCLRDADALIILGSDEPGYTASKALSYVLARKPLLAILHERSSVVRMLDVLNAATVVTFGDGEDPEQIARKVESSWLRQLPPRRPDTDWRAFERHTAREMTRRLCEVFDTVAAAHPRGNPA